MQPLFHLDDRRLELRVALPPELNKASIDEDVLAATREALGRMRAPAELTVIRGAGHVFEEPGALGETARLTAEWLRQWLPRSTLL